ncbi:MAG TPA: STAS domain-containing protein [bacterium]|jgi:anti-anti-sigma factor
MATPVSIDISQLDGIPVAHVSGEVDLSNIADVRAAIAGAITNASRALVVDLSGTTYMDSRGVHLLFELAERLARSQQQFAVVVPPEAPIRRLLLITHLDQAAAIHETVGDAISRLG